MTYCDNCGRRSHCGVPLYEDFRTPYYEKFLGEIKVCDHCRCKECTNDKEARRTVRSTIVKRSD